MRFSLKWLLIAVAFVAVSLVALLNANSEWQSACENVALLLLLISVAGMVGLMGEWRMFWFGYFLFGMTYFVLATGFFVFNQSWRLLPTRGLSYVHRQAFTPQSEVVPYGAGFEGDIVSQQPALPNGSIPVMIIRPMRSYFTNVGNALFCIPFGLLGGMIARSFYRRRTVTIAHFRSKSSKRKDARLGLQLNRFPYRRAMLSCVDVRKTSAIKAICFRADFR